MIILFIFLTILLLIALQKFINRYIIKKALRDYIEPKLKKRGFTFIYYEWPDLFSNGDFEDDSLMVTIINLRGRVSYSTYVYIYYKEFDGTKRVTARIDTTFYSIDEVVYSSEF